ncbi:hypothetical protein BFINE_26560 [Bacteroides finegoldii DSM 17565]|nr:hypothetical protein BFINE_26560 [Bacteroides finegoldii DSM 17565]
MILARGNIARTKKLCYDKEKEEAFKERDEGKRTSLHCSPMIVTKERRIRKWTKWIKAIVEFAKALIQLSSAIKF